MPLKLITKDIPEASQVVHVAGTPNPVTVLSVLVPKRRAYDVLRTSIVLSMFSAAAVELPVDSLFILGIIRPGLAAPIEIARLDYGPFSGLSVSDQRSELYRGSLQIIPHPTASGNAPRANPDDQLVLCAESSVALDWTKSTVQFHVQESILQAR